MPSTHSATKNKSKKPIPNWIEEVIETAKSGEVGNENTIN